MLITQKMNTGLFWNYSIYQHEVKPNVFRYSITIDRTQTKVIGYGNGIETKEFSSIKEVKNWIKNNTNKEVQKDLLDNLM